MILSGRKVFLLDAGDTKTCGSGQVLAYNVRPRCLVETVPWQDVTAGRLPVWVSGSTPDFSLWISSGLLRDAAA